MEGLTRMQARAIFEAASMVQGEGTRVLPEVMIPLVSHVNELRAQREIVDEVAQAVAAESGRSVAYRIGTMIEVPRAALTADRLAEEAAFFSLGTNDLTQTTYAISRDDAEKGFLLEYVSRDILPENPFVTLDQDGVGRLVAIAVERGRSVRPDLEIGICGEHGGLDRVLSRSRPRLRELLYVPGAGGPAGGGPGGAERGRPRPSRATAGNRLGRIVAPGSRSSLS
jgi:pyruvate,orthophosphate dikinase